MDSRVHRDLLVRRVKQVSREEPELMVPRVFREVREVRAPPVQTVPKGRRDRRDPQEQRDRREMPDPRVLRVLLGVQPIRVPRVLWERPEKWVLKVPRDLQDPLPTPVRRG